MEATTIDTIALEPVFKVAPPAPATMRKVALYYAEMGWHIFPLHTVKEGRCSCGVVDCDHAGKHPRTKHGLSDATADKRIVERWWEQWPDANIGFHPGPSGIVVLDLDSYKANYAGVKLTFAEKQTVTGITGGGGEHLFFSAGGVQYRSRNRAVDGVDIKAMGGYVILAPSLHRSGQRYVWEVGYAPWEFGLAPVPEMVKAILSSEREVKVKTGANGHTVDAGREFERAREALGRLRVGRADDYDDWLKVGMALSELGDKGFDLWDEWSQQSGKYKEGITAAKWPTFKAGQGVTLASLHHWAQQDSPVVKVSKNGAKAEEGQAEEVPVQAMTPEESEVLDYLGKNEMGDAEMMAAMYKGKVVYDHAESAWHVWNEHHWLRDERGQVNNIPTQVLSVTYMDTAAAMAKAANENEATLKRVKELYKRAFLLRTRARRSNVLDLASSHPDLAVAGSEWDAHPWLLAVKNGVVDLQTGKHRPGQPEDYMRIVAPVEWKGLDAPAPRWEQFLTEVFNGDDELIAFLQRLFGYAITGLSTEHVLPILWGKGFNGKDTLLKALAFVLGPGYADTVPEDVFIDIGKSGGANAQPHIYRLRGLRMAWASETEDGARLKGGQVKMISGGGILTARPLYGSPVSWQATHTVMLITNHRPHVNDDYAIWKRLLLIEFTMSFVDEPQDASERKRDANLDAKLQAEAPGILAWLVRGCLAWQRDGLNPPASVKQATESYRTDEDTLGKWIDENCVVGPLYRCKAQEAYKSYTDWCDNQHHRPLNGTNFGKKLTERYQKEHTRNGAQYVGIGLLTEQGER